MAHRRSTERGPGSNQHADQPPLPPLDPTPTATAVLDMDDDPLFGEHPEGRRPHDNPYDLTVMDVPRIPERPDVEQAIDRYLDTFVEGRSNHRPALVLIGPQGSGKSQYLHRVLADYDGRVELMDVSFSAGLGDLADDLHTKGTSLFRRADIDVDAKVPVLNLGVAFHLPSDDPCADLSVLLTDAVQRQSSRIHKTRLPLLLRANGLHDSQEGHRRLSELLTAIDLSNRALSRAGGNRAARVGLVASLPPSMFHTAREGGAMTKHLARVDRDTAVRLLKGPAAGEPLFADGAVDVLVDASGGCPDLLRAYGSDAWNHTPAGRRLDADGALRVVRRVESDRFVTHENQFQRLSPEARRVLYLVASMSEGDRPRMTAQQLRTEGPLLGADAGSSVSGLSEVMGAGLVVHDSLDAKPKFAGYGTPTEFRLYDPSMVRWLSLNREVLPTIPPPLPVL